MIDFNKIKVTLLDCEDYETYDSEEPDENTLKELYPKEYEEYGNMDEEYIEENSFYEYLNFECSINEIEIIETIKNSENDDPKIRYKAIWDDTYIRLFEIRLEEVD